VLAALAVGLAVALGALAAYILVHHDLLAQVDDSLNSQTRAAIRISPEGALGVTARLIDQENVAWFVEPGGATVLLTPPGGVGPSTLTVSSGIKALAGDSTRGYSVLATKSIAGADYRMIAVSLGGPLILTIGGSTEAVPSGALVIAHPLNDIDRTLSDLRLILFLVGLSGVALAMAMGYAAARAMIRPVERLTAAAEHVALTQDLGARIPEEGDDELARLARSFNAMLGALASSRQQQAQLVADAGHELRTPLTSLRTNIELLMRAPDLPTVDRDELLSDVQAQLEEFSTLVGDLVEMARDDEQLVEPLDVAFDEIVEHAVERARRRAMSLTFSVSLDRGLVRAQPALLERAVLNVLDNAAKWSPPGGQVDVTLRRGAAWVLEVRDHGPGITPEDLPKVFDRFYRAPTARRMPGSGLGLAIVRQAVESHGGSVSIQLPADGGTLIHIELPVVAPAPWPPPPSPTAVFAGSDGSAWPAAPAVPPTDPVPSGSER